MEKKFFCFLILISIFRLLPAQPVFPSVQAPAAELTKLKHDSNFFKTSVDYLTNNVWQGRKDDVTQAYFTPAIGYIHKSGLYADAALACVPYNSPQVDLFILDAGYDYSFLTYFAASLYAAKYFYNNNSESVRSSSGSSVSAGLSYTPAGELFQISETGDISFAKNNDYSLLSEIAHTFYVGSKGQYTIVPDLGMNMGTQNYYSSFIQTRPARRKRRNGSQGSTTVVTGTVAGASAFQVLDYEVSCPVSFDGKKWGADLKPVYALPLHPVSYKISPGNKIITEQLSNSLYVEVGAYLKF